MNLTKEQHQRLIDIVERKVLNESNHWGISVKDHPDLKLLLKLTNPFN